MLELGTTAPYFSLPEPATGNTVSIGDLDDAQGLVVVFMCNHCPYVRHIADELARFAREYQGKGIAMVGISANDVSTHPDDSPEKMAQEVERRGYVFPYLYDETQAVAQAYRAACTPDLYLFDRARKLVYRGRFDAATPGNKVPVSGADLRAACDALLAGEPVSADQHPSMGCNIKWRAGNEPAA
jgi:peroxiredoxin